MKRWPLHKAHFWETAPFFRLLLPLAAGIVCYNMGWAGFITGCDSLIIASIAFLLFLPVVISGKGNEIYRVAVFCLLNLIMLSIGFSVSWYNDIRNDKQWFGDNLNTHTVYLARISNAPVEKDRSWKVPVTIVSTITGGKASPAKGNAFIYLYKDYSPMLLHKRDSILVPNKWQAIKNAGNPFEFDYANYCRQNNLYYQQSCSANDIRLFATHDDRDASFTDRAHDWCMSQLGKYIPEPKTKGLLQAMLLGDEVNLDEDLRQSYADTGIIHIIAISGCHVVFFFMAVSLLLWWLKHRKHLWIKYTVALPLVWFYIVMAGATPSAVRAAIMFSILAFSVIVQKNNNSLNTLFATAFLLLCAQPMWLFSLGFQLSFVAVLSIVLFYKPVYGWLSPTHKIMRFLWSTVAVSIAAEIFVAPLVIWYLHTFPLLFIATNAIAYLFMCAALALSMAVIALSWMPVVAKGIGFGTIWFVTGFDKLVVYMQGLNPMSFHFLVLTGVELILVYAIVSGIALFLMKKKKQPLFISLICACILLLLFCRDEWLCLQQQRLVVYNIGKTNHIELINGPAFSLISTDTPSQKKTGYAVIPSHIYWHAWKTDTIAIPDEIFNVGGKKTLILNRDIASNDQFPVDYLIINYNGEPNLAQFQKIFSPSLIIIGNNYSLKEQEALIKDSKQLNIYAVSERGAFVIN